MIMMIIMMIMMSVRQARAVAISVGEEDGFVGARLCNKYTANSSTNNDTYSNTNNNTNSSDTNNSTNNSNSNTNNTNHANNAKLVPDLYHKPISLSHFKQSKTAVRNISVGS